MQRLILMYGTIAGLIVGLPLFVMTVALKDHPPLPYALALGYTIMLVALSAVFMGVKRRRDVDLGGVIGFWPALGLGLAISAVATLFYVVAWELALIVSDIDFIGQYTKALVAQQQAKGASEEAIAKLIAEMDAFKIQYANPLFRWVTTASEILPVGVLVSLITAAVLRDPRVLPARRG